MTSLEDKVAIVTGAARGIGKGIAIHLARAGAKVVVADVLPERDATVLEIEAEGGSAIAVETDVSKNDSVLNLVNRSLEEYGKIDVLVSNAAVESRGVLEDVKEEEWDRLYSVNVKGLYLCCKHVLPHMKERRTGSIIAIGSATSVKGFPEFAAYSGTKGAVLQIVRCLALEVRALGIRVNCLCPGMTDTEMGRAAMAAYGDGTDQIIVDTQGRWGLPEDLAKAAVFLASEDSEFVTGQPIHVDGGLTT